VVLDEPTASLPAPEVDRLLVAVARVREMGVAIIYVTHRLSEIVRVPDEFVVLRNGAVAEQGSVAQTPPSDLVRFGSDPGSMRTRARKDGTDWFLDGRKMWITNGTIADVAVVWAQTEDKIRGFVVPTNTPGFAAPEIKHKQSLRASVTSELVLDGVRLPESAVLPDVSGLKGPLSCLNEARYDILWGAMGAARSSLESTLSYANDRIQFDKPISAFQLTQQKLVDMNLEYTKGVLLALHLGRRKDAGLLRPEQVSLGKLNNVREALEICRTARTILGANGISLEYPVMRHANNLESVLTYEGTVEMHTLVLGQAMTGQAAFR
jgi:glutaryl-CoA dehydrogenase